MHYGNQVVEFLCGMTGYMLGTVVYDLFFAKPRIHINIDVDCAMSKADIAQAVIDSYEAAVQLPAVPGKR